MRHFCNKCGNNWARLETCDDEHGDEQYDVCPICHTDSFLTEGKEGKAYMYCKITGNIIDVETGKTRITEPKTYTTYKPFDYGAFYKSLEEREAEHERQENERLEKMGI